MGRIRIIIRKIFSVSLVFNALLTISCIVGILSGYYWYYNKWEPFTPFLMSGHLLWIAFAVAIINIFPSAAMGRSLHTGRFLFHHYFYGFLVLLAAIIYVLILVPVPLYILFFVDNTSVSINLGRFFILGGLALILDDLPDVSVRIESALNNLKIHIGQRERIMSVIQLVSGAITMYIFAAIVLSMYYVREWITLANIIVVSSIFITAITSFIFVRRKVWLKIKQ